MHKQQNEVKPSFNSANKYTDGRRCKRHREGLCSYTKRGYAGTGSVSTEKCGAANTERDMQVLDCKQMQKEMCRQW